MKRKEEQPYRIGAITVFERFSCKVVDFVNQETCTPAKCTADLLHGDLQQWHEAWEMWEGWMESLWKDLAISHAGGQLTDEEYRQQYGLWKDRKKQEGAGKDLLWIIGCLQRPGNGWMH